MLILSLTLFLPFLLTFFGGLVLIVLLLMLFGGLKVMRIGGANYHEFERARRERDGAYGRYEAERRERPPRDEPGGWSEGEQEGEVVELPESVLRKDDEK